MQTSACTSVQHWDVLWPINDLGIKFWIEWKNGTLKHISTYEVDWNLKKVHGPNTAPLWHPFYQSSLWDVEQRLTFIANNDASCAAANVKHRAAASPSPPPINTPFISNWCHQLRDVRGTEGKEHMLQADEVAPDCPCLSALQISCRGFAPAQHLHHMDALLHSNDVSVSASRRSLTRDDRKPKKKKKKN